MKQNCKEVRKKLLRLDKAGNQKKIKHTKINDFSSRTVFLVQLASC